MLAPDLLFSVWEDIVTSHVADVSFYHDTNRLLDRAEGTAWPACFWALPSMTLQKDAEVYRPVYRLSMLFLDQTATDRSPTDMLDAHSRMASIAAQCWVRFSDLYLVDSGTFEGANVDVELVGNPVFTPVYDDDTTMLTGVRLEASLKDTSAPYCVTGYFQ